MNDFLSLDNLPVIESKQNSQVRKLQKIVSSSSYRQENKLYWVEGEKLCKTYPNKIEYLFSLAECYMQDKNYKKVSKALFLLV